MKRTVSRPFTSMRRALENRGFENSNVCDLLNPRRPRYAQNTTDASSGSALDPFVSRHRRLGKGSWINPDIVAGSMMMQYTRMLAQMPFELSAIH
jgi:hypothetical protein